jgi:hypothetical protein
MKETGPLIIMLVIVAAIILSLHQKGGQISGAFKTTENFPKIQNSGPVYQAQNTTNYGSKSPFEGDITISDVMEPGRLAASEYIVLSSYSSESVNITGWSIVSEKTGNKIYIPGASYIPLIEIERPVIINGNQKIIIHTGSSPIGVSFRKNVCVGYIEEKIGFSPRLGARCPNIDNGNLPTQIENSSLCMEYINSLRTCELPKKNLPTMPAYCENFVKQNISYEGCVNTNKNSRYFYENEWRIFIKSRIPLWRQEKEGKNNQEILKLLDAQGRLVDTITY